MRWLLMTLFLTVGCSSNDNNGGPDDPDGVGCENSVTYGQCENGYYATDSCPAGETCVTESGCSTEYDSLCAPRRTIDPETYGAQSCWSSADCFESDATACEEDTDCALVPSGDVCGCVECNTAAIHVDVAEEYRARLDEARAAHCTPEPCAADCMDFVARCDAGTCVAATM